MKPIPETACECLHGTDYRNYSIALDPLDWSEYSSNLVWTSENGTACITNESIATLTLAQVFESAIGNLSLPFPFTRWGSIEASVSIHRCQAYVGTYCYACGLYHTGEGGCGHDAGCAAFLALENECTCAPRFVRVNSDDDNFSGTEDRTESPLPEGENDLLSFTPLDFTRTCCCYEGARSHVKLTAVSSGLRLWKDGETICVGEEIPGGSGFTIEATDKSPTLGGFAVSYDIYDVETNLVRSITRRFTAANVQIKPDYDDDGAFTADDAWLKTQERPGEEWLVARREAPYKIKLQNECPSDAVLEVCMTGSTNRPALKTSPEGPAVMTPFTGVATNAPLSVKNSGTTVWLDASGTNATASLEYRIAPPGGGHLVSDSQPIRVVDTSIDERWIKKDTYTTYDFSDSTTNIYWEAWSYEDWSCVDFGVGGSFEVGPNLPIGDYEVYAYFADMVTDNLSYGTLHVVDTDIAEDEYAVQCGTTNRVEVSLDTADSYGPADWRIEPVLEDGARLYASESGGTGSTTFSDGTRVWISAGDIATNYTVTAYHPECTNAMDTAVVHVMSLEFNGLHYFIQRGSTNRNEVSSFVENMNGCDLDWSLSPGLSNGARISSQSTGGSEDLSLSGFADVYVKAGFVATNFVLTAHHSTFSNIVNSAEVSVMGIDIPEERYGMQSNATTRAHFTGAIENMDVADLTWEISPSISGGARLHAGPATPDGSATLTGSTNVWVSSGSICTNYTLKAYFRYVEEIEDIVEFTILSVEFLNSAKNPTTHLNVGKWENGFNSGPTIKDNFIDIDPDCFYVSVNDASQAGSGHVSVTLSTDSEGISYDDDATEIELNEFPACSGIFISTNMILVADDVDDDFTNSSIVSDDTENDRTHKIGLGGKVRILYQGSNMGAEAYEKEASVPPALRTLTISVVILRDKALADGGTAVASPSTVSNHWEAVCERYAQTGVKINWAISVSDPPLSVNLADGIAATSSTNTHEVSTEMKALIDELGSGNDNNDFHAFYVSGLYWTLSPALDPLYGVGIANYWFDPSEDGYLFNAIMSSTTIADGKLFNPAHEVGHCLTDAGHHGNVWNIMATPTSISNTVTATKRFDDTQGGAIHNETHCKP